MARYFAFFDPSDFSLGGLADESSVDTSMASPSSGDDSTAPWASSSLGIEEFVADTPSAAVVGLNMLAVAAPGFEKGVLVSVREVMVGVKVTVERVVGDTIVAELKLESMSILRGQVNC